MDLIEHTFTIQWVGPMNYEEYKSYIRNQETLSSDLFNLYYFEARKDGRCNWSKYVGIHKQNDGIDKRLNTSHEHLGTFIKAEAKHMRIWIGSFANIKDQKTENVDIVETLLIKAYPSLLNVKKKRSLPQNSICIINTYYTTSEDVVKKKSDKPSVFDDVLIYLEESECFMPGNLTKMRGL